MRGVRTSSEAVMAFAAARALVQGAKMPEAERQAAYWIAALPAWLRVSSQALAELWRGRGFARALETLPGWGRPDPPPYPLARPWPRRRALKLRRPPPRPLKATLHRPPAPQPC